MVEVYTRLCVRMGEFSLRKLHSAIFSQMLMHRLFFFLWQKKNFQQVQVRHESNNAT